MNATITGIEEILKAVDQFTMTASLRNMERFGAQLGFAPSDGGLLEYAHDEARALLSLDRREFADECSAATTVALRQTLKGVLISMAGGSSGGSAIDALLRDAALEWEADQADEPCIAAFPISWRSDELRGHRPHRAIVTTAQMEAAGPPGRAGERGLVKAILEARYGGRIHRMEHRRLDGGFIPGPIHENFARHERYFSQVLRRPETQVPTDEREILRGVTRNALDRSLRARMEFEANERGTREREAA